MGKIRLHQAYVSISASGPLFDPKFEERGYLMRPRMAADLKYTTADVDFLETYWKEPAPDSGKEEEFFRLRNPTIREVRSAFASAQEWLSSCKAKSSGWDGGAINVTYAGHGQNGDGALVLKDGVFGADDLVEVLNTTALAVSNPHTLRVSMLLDSCYSGALLTRLLRRVLSDEEVHLYVRDAMAASMPDEIAWEESTLAHGLFTYSFSVREQSLMALAASAVQPNNTRGPAVSILKGAYGCSLLSAGEQNALDYAGTAHITVCGVDVPLLDANDMARVVPDVEADLRKERDRFKAGMQFVSRRFKMDGQRTDSEVRGDIEKTLADSEMLAQAAERNRRS